MRNEVTEKLEVFLQNLRCEDAKRETLVHLDSCQKEAERLAGLEEQYTQVMDGLEQRSRAILEHYIERILSKAFAEQQHTVQTAVFSVFVGYDRAKLFFDRIRKRHIITPYKP